MRKSVLTCTVVGLLLMLAMEPASLWAGASGGAKKSLERLLLGKDVRALTQLPATKEGVKVYLTPPEGKDWDQRGLNVKHLTKWLKERGVGVEANEVVAITDVKVGGDTVEIHLGGGGMGRRGSKHVQETDPGFKRAGGSRINFHYGRDIADADLEPSAFLDFLGRLLDVSSIREEAAKSALSPEARRAVESKNVAAGMTYQMVLLSWGEPEQKKINESGDGKLSESWFYMKDGRRVVVDFMNGKVAKVQTF
jgi:hypothetical protein